MSFFARIAVLAFATLLLGACAPVLIGAAATTGLVVAQERSIGNAIDDFGIQAAVGNKLYDANDATYRQVDLEVVEGRVLMTGRVQTQDDRIEASRRAWTTRGVEEVINEIEVHNDAVITLRPNDVWISARLRARLVRDRGIRQINYHIQTQNGTVYLIGIAQDEEELTRATEHARSIRGVTRVISHMRLKDERIQPPAQGT